MVHIKTIGLAIIIVLLSGVPGRAVAGSYIFTKIADTSTPIPGGSGTFTSLFNDPSVDDCR